MACTITINDVRGILNADGTTLSAVRVSGTASDCDEVKITAIMGGDAVSRTVGVSQGSWSVDIPAQDFRVAVSCGQSIRVDVTCTGGDCSSQFGPKPLECGPGCPSATVSVVSIADGCVNGRRAVDLRAVVSTSSSPTIVEWDFGDGSTGTSVVVADGQVVDISHDYVAGNSYTARLTIVFPEGCPAIELPVQLAECEPSDCPTTVQLEVVNPQGRVVRLSSVDCVPSGRYRVRVVRPSGQGLRFTWSRNGQQDASVSGDTYSVSVGAASPSVTVTVTVDQPDRPECLPASGGVTLEACDPCPNVAVSVANPGSCDASGNVPVSWRVQSAPAGQDVRVQLDFGDGSVSPEATIPAGGGEHVFDAHPYAAPGTYTPVVRVIAPRGCGDVSGPPLELDACEPRNGGGGGGDGSIDWCSILRFTTILLFGLFALALGILLCPMMLMGAPPDIVAIVAGIGVAVTAVLFIISLIAWAVVCRPDWCDFLELAWQVLFLAAAVMIYFWACPACAHVGWVGLGLLVVAAILFAVWIGLCRPEPCAVFNRLMLLAVVFDIVAALEILAGWCVITSQPVLAGVYAAFVAAFTAFAFWGQQTYCRIAPAAAARLAAPRALSASSARSLRATRARTTAPDKKCKCQEHGR